LADRTKGNLVTREKLKTIAIVLLATMTLPGLSVLYLRWWGITGSLTSDSEPRGLYLVTRAQIDIPNRGFERGDMVELRQLMKHVAGVPGDVVRVTPEGSYINGKLWPNSAVPAATNYHPYPNGTYKLAPDQYWLLGRNPWSWDSRYFGMVPLDLIACTVKPVWTVSNGYAPGTKPW
jgi:type IV secretory pathway protease TraF